MSERLSPEEARSYWKSLHESGQDALATVLFPGKSRLLNEFMDRTEKYAVRRAIRTAIGNVSGKAVLDIGSGTGRWLEVYRALGAKPVGVDIAPAAVAHSIALGFDVRLEPAEALPFADSSFDVVNEIVVLLHLPPASQIAAIKEIERVCRPAGYIVMLDITAEDRSPHVFPRGLDDWVALFRDSTLVFAENHYYALPLRWLWRSRLMRLPAVIVRVLEDLAVIASIPVEFVAMQIFRGKTGSRGLQHVMIFRRHDLSEREPHSAPGPLAEPILLSPS